MIVDPNGKDTAFADDKARTLFINALSRVNKKVEAGNRKLERVLGEAIDDQGRVDYDCIIHGDISERKIAKAEKIAEKYAKWNELKSDFDKVLDPNTQKVTYSVNSERLEKGEGGRTTNTNGILEVILAGNYPNSEYNESVVIHENRHVNQILSGQEYWWGSEVDAYRFQGVYSPSFLKEFKTQFKSNDLWQATKNAYPNLK